MNDKHAEPADKAASSALKALLPLNRNCVLDVPAAGFFIAKIRKGGIFLTLVR
ncbi:MAG: hypothetical protein MJ196_08115 [Treponemataceae bacterium]|nr:hypothetical protein [Treponemataceae bacterium]